MRKKNLKQAHILPLSINYTNDSYLYYLLKSLS